MKNGKAAMLFLKEVEESIDIAKKDPTLKPYADKLEESVNELKKVTAHLVGLAMEGKIDLFLADATLYLEFFGIVAIGWQWLLQAVAVQKAIRGNPSESDMKFYRGKLHTFRYFFCYELPKIKGLTESLLTSNGLTLEMNKELF
jgi:butyryl-CoA dehydrogenase